MGDKSAIEWTDATWNPVTGCDRVSPGCAHCYALDLAARLKRMGQARYQRLGVSIENRRFVHRAELLRQTPAAVRFISAEPLLGPLVYDGALGTPRDIAHRHHSVSRCWFDGFDGPELDLTGIDWVIVGGESGPQHRPMRIEWARDLRDACAPVATAFFFKQVGGRTPKSAGRLLDGRTWDEMPVLHTEVPA